jgi:hypothetical protein
MIPMKLTDRTVMVTDTFVRPSDLGVSFELVRCVPGTLDGYVYTADSIDEVFAAANSIGADFMVTHHPDLLSCKKQKKIPIVTPEAYLQLSDVGRPTETQ